MINFKFNPSFLTIAFGLLLIFTVLHIIFAQVKSPPTNNQNPTPMVQTSPAKNPQLENTPAIMNSATDGCKSDTLKIMALDSQTFVTVKDQGEDEVIFVFKLDEQGRLSLVSKKKFFY